MWASAAEEQPMILRNTIEYEYEGWDYTQVVEEQDFALVEGRLIHPVHMWSLGRLLMEQQQQQSQLQLLQACPIQQQFCRILYAQQQQHKHKHHQQNVRQQRRCGSSSSSSS
jgi:hypothetical protein